MGSEFIQTFERELHKPIRETSEKFREVLQYSLDDGKRYRPLLVFASYKSSGGEKLEKVIPVSCAIEYVHTASLLLDDLPCMDNSQTRRNKPSVHLKYGEARTILAGIYFLNLAYNLLSKQEQGKKLIEILSSTVEKTIVGQLIDLGLGQIGNGLQKTYPLFSISSRIGGLMADVNNECQLQLENAGIEIGRAFQFIDDYEESNDPNLQNEIAQHLSNARLIIPSFSRPEFLEDYISKLEERAK